MTVFRDVNVFVKAAYLRLVYDNNREAEQNDVASIAVSANIYIIPHGSDSRRFF